MSLPNGQNKYKKLELVLSGGGAKGFAHIGILKVLLEEGIPISSICGCSMGGLIAALFATGVPLSGIEKTARKFISIREMIKLVDRTPSRRGLMAGKNIRKYLSSLIHPEASFEDCLIPLTLNTVDLISEEEIGLNSGNLLDSVMATTAIPGFFAPVEIGPYRLVDGGILDNLPVKFAKKPPAEFILAIDVHHNQNTYFSPPEDFHLHGFPLPLPELFYDFYRAETIMTYKLTELNLLLNPPDLLLRPVLPENVSIFWGFQRVNEIIAAGEELMREKLPELIAGLRIEV